MAKPERIHYFQSGISGIPSMILTGIVISGILGLVDILLIAVGIAATITFMFWYLRSLKRVDLYNDYINITSYLGRKLYSKIPYSELEEVAFIVGDGQRASCWFKFRSEKPESFQIFFRDYVPTPQLEFLSSKGVKVVGPEGVPIGF